MCVIHQSEISTVLDLRQNGQTYQAIGDRYGVTRERIRQIVKQHVPHLTGWKTHHPSRYCVDCGVEIYTKLYGDLCREHGVLVNRRRRAFKYVEVKRAMYNDMKQMRSNGCTWSSIGRKWFSEHTTENSRITHCFSFLKLYEAKVALINSSGTATIPPPPNGQNQTG